MIIGDIDGAARHLPQRADAKLQAISGPGFLLDLE